MKLVKAVLSSLLSALLSLLYIYIYNIEMSKNTRANTIEIVFFLNKRAETNTKYTISECKGSFNRKLIFYFFQVKMQQSQTIHQTCMFNSSNKYKKKKKKKTDKIFPDRF